MWIAIIIGAVLIPGLLFYASYSISAGVYLRSLCRNKKAPRQVALTFDDGVDPVMTPKVLEVLKRHGVKATFFIIGEKAAAHPQLVERMVWEGHVIGNHSYFHKTSFPMQKSAVIEEEIHKCSAVLEQAGGGPIKLFRPPFGVTNPMIGRAVRGAGLISIGWSIRSLDTLGWGVEWVRRRVSCRLKRGGVILLHDNLPEADVLLEQLLEEINKKGLIPVTIYELFEIEQKKCLEKDF